MTEKIDLTWHTFQTHSNELLSDLYKSSSFSDVTLVTVDQTQFKCHKFVLSACSSVFRNILKTDLNSPFIYLRGIAREEMESVLQFMYLGEATFYQERMNEFLNVAKDLDLKEIGQSVDVNEVEAEHTQGDIIQELSSSDDDDNDCNMLKSYSTATTFPLNENGKFACNHCQLSYSSKSHLVRHVKAEHEGVRYPCTQCDYKATQLGNLEVHVKSKHEGVRYPCQKCDYKSAFPSALDRHVKAEHDGVRYKCQYCDYEAKFQSALKYHMKTKH